MRRGVAILAHQFISSTHAVPYMGMDGGGRVQTRFPNPLPHADGTILKLALGAFQLGVGGGEVLEFGG